MIQNYFNRARTFPCDKNVKTQIEKNNNIEAVFSKTIFEGCDKVGYDDFEDAKIFSSSAFTIIVAEIHRYML